MRTRKDFNSIMSLDIKTQVISMVIVTTIGVYAFALITGQKSNIAPLAIIGLLLVISSMIGRFVCRSIIKKNWTPKEKIHVLEDTILFNDRRNIRLLIKAGADLKKVDRWYIDNRANKKTKKLLAKLA